MGPRGLDPLCDGNTVHSVPQFDVTAVEVSATVSDVEARAQAAHVVHAVVLSPFLHFRQCLVEL